MIVYKICRRIGDEKYKSSIIIGKYVIIYELGKTIHRELMLPLVFNNLENAERFLCLAFSRRSTDTVILKCKASGLIKIDIVNDYANEKGFHRFWYIYKKVKYHRKNVSFRKNNLSIYNTPRGTFGAKKLTPLEEVSFKW